jgi:hypothetical protein
LAKLILTRHCAYTPNSKPGDTNIQKSGSSNISDPAPVAGAQGKVALGYAADGPCLSIGAFTLVAAARANAGLVIQCKDWYYTS